MTPQPVCRSPGSSPKTRILANRPLGSPRRRSGAKPRQDVLGYLEIGINILDIVAVFERLEQFKQGNGGLLIDWCGGFRPPHETSGCCRAEALFECVAHGVEFVGGAADRMLLGVAVDILRAGLKCGVEHLVGVRRCARTDNLADAIE